MKRLEHTGRVWYVAFSLDGKQIITKAEPVPGRPSHTRIWDAESGEQIQILTDAGLLFGLYAFLPDGKIIVAQTLGARDNIVRILEADTERVISEYKLEGGIFSCSPDGKRIATTDGYDNRVVRIWTLGEYAPSVSTERFIPTGCRPTGGRGQEHRIKITARIGRLIPGESLMTQT